MKWIPACVVLMGLLCVGIGFAQEPPDSPVSRQLADLEQSAGMIARLMETAQAAGIDCRSCQLNTQLGGSGGQEYLLTLAGNDMGSLRDFFSRLEKSWNVAYREILLKASRSSVESGGTLTAKVRIALGPEITSRDVMAFEKLLGPFVDLSFFSPLSGSPPQGVMLYDVQCSAGDPVRFQFVASSLQELKGLMLKDGVNGISQTLSKSRFLEHDIFTLDFAATGPGESGKELIRLYETFSPVAEITELRVNKTGSPVVVLRFAGGTSVAPALLEAVGRELALRPVEMKIQKNEGVLHLGSGAPAAPEPEVQGFFELIRAQALDDVGALKEAFWRAGRVELTVTRPLAAEAELNQSLQNVKGAARALGFENEGTRTKPDGEGALSIHLVFGKTRSEVAVPSTGEKSWQSFLDTIDVVEKGPAGRGMGYSLKMPFARLPELLGLIKSSESGGIEEFSLTCRFGDNALVRCVVPAAATPDQKQKLAFIQQILSASTITWHCPDERAKNAVVLQAFSIDSLGAMQVSGITLKSSRIFAELFPALKKQGIADPFFAEGNYKDHELGRMMTFKVTGRLR
jgi:hypothetical protein